MREFNETNNIGFFRNQTCNSFIFSRNKNNTIYNYIENLSLNDTPRSEVHLMFFTNVLINYDSSYYEIQHKYDKDHDVLLYNVILLYVSI